VATATRLRAPRDRRPRASTVSRHPIRILLDGLPGALATEHPLVQRLAGRPCGRSQSVAATHRNELGLTTPDTLVSSCAAPVALSERPSAYLNDRPRCNVQSRCSGDATYASGRYSAASLAAFFRTVARRLSACATPAPYAGSAIVQLATWRCWICTAAPPTDRAVFSNKIWR